MTKMPISFSSDHHHHLLFSFCFFFFFFFFTITTTISAATSTSTPTTFIYAGCSQSKFTANSPFEQNLKSLLSSFSQLSSLSSFSSSSSSSSPAAYGLFQCLPSLPLSSCSSCIHSSISQLSSLCSSSTSATLLLHSCLLRYSNSSFFGHTDTTLLLKTCGPSLPSSTDITAMRDTALSQLLQTSSSSPSSPYYHLAGAGYIQAESQCDGDLSPKACSECAMLAVRQLRNACGDATLAGDVYLGRCFARFWSIAVYSHQPSSSTGDEAEKTFAIIIGLLAGVALLIVFLSFIRRAANAGK